ncbi:ATP-binding protein [Nocardia sp. NPDC051030]|uniref:ATP-binding protein n=1 Tax=Nocardia sp. NPDC051030 TaxID=3155162 RepID=UPI00341A4F01
MSESSNPPGGEPEAVRGARIPFRTLSTCIGLSIVGVAATVLAAPHDFRIPLAVGASALAALLCAAVTAAVYYRSEVERARREGQGRAAWAEARTAAVITEAEQRMGSVVTEAQGRIAEVEARIRLLDDAAGHQARDARDSENRRAAAMAAFAGAAGRMQAMSTSMLAELREMEHRHGDPKVLADLLELDHRTAQAGRLADSIAVLSGARSGRRWAKPIAMESILRGAMGRVAGYQRVRLRAVSDIAIAGHAAEGVMHALAELLDNACNFSPPTTEVHVYAAEVPAGVVITIEDSGLVMSESALRRAELTVSGKTGHGSDLSSLAGTRLGLAVVGHLARKHELTVSYRPSAIGGTAVVVVVPRELTTRLDRTGTLSAIPLPVQLPINPQPEVAAGTLPAAPQLEPAALTSLPQAEPAARALTSLSQTGSHILNSPPQAEPSRALPAPPHTQAHPEQDSRALTGSAQTASAGRTLPAPPETPAYPAQDPRTSSGSAQAGLAGRTLADLVAATAENAAIATGSADSGRASTDLADETASATAPSTTSAVTASGLPKRRRGTTLAAVHPGGLPDLLPESSNPAGTSPSARPASSPSALAAFQRAMNRENTGGATPSPTVSLETEH